MSIPLKIDNKGRVSIPKQLRERAGLEPGDALFLEYDESSNTFHLKKAINPFDILALEALREYEAGETRSLDEVMAELGVEPEHDEPE
jgi:AbrB family looped-hinge helix DNA binding protein